MSSHHPHGELVNENVHHEASDINVRAIITFIVVLSGITIALQIIVYGLFLLFNKIEDKTQPHVSPLVPAAAQVGDFPSPSLQTTPWTDLQKLRAGENAYLHSYGWVDERAGIARVPIEKAKSMLLQKGLPVRAGAAADPAEGTHVAATGESNGGRTLPGGQADASSGTPAPPPSPSAAPVNATMPPAPDAAKKPGGGL